MNGFFALLEGLFVVFARLIAFVFKALFGAVSGLVSLFRKT
jgi:hypothetical protein